MSADQEVMSSLADALAANIPEWYGAGARLRAGSAALHTYPYSFFISYPVETPRGEQTLLAKIHRKPDMPTVQDALAADWLRPIARDEYEMTRLIQRAFEEENSPVCAAVQPLGFMDEWNAILMRKVEGKALKKYLLRAPVVLRFPKALAELREYLEASVHWLRIFHQRVGEAQEARFPASGVLDWMNEILSKLDMHSQGQVDVEPYRSALSVRAERLKELRVPVALLHDDFQYSNILITTKRQACVLDYALTDRGCVYADLATLIIDPQTRAAQILTGGRFISSGFIRAINQTILDAYFDGKPHHENVLDFYCALAVINKWSADEAEMTAAWRKKPYPLSRQTTRGYYARLLSQYL